MKWKYYKECKCNDLFKTLESLPARVDENWCTMCALTARLNWRLFGVVLPKWNAFDALEHPGLGCTWTLPKWKEHSIPNSTWTPIGYDEFIKAWKSADISDMAVSQISEDSNLMDHKLWIQLIADIAVGSDSENWKIFWHRVLAYKMYWKWFVLDPYVKWNDWKWIELAEYMKTHNILKCNFYESSWYNFQRYKEQADNWATVLRGRWEKQQEVVETFIGQQDDSKTALLLVKMNNWESLNNDDRLQLIDDNESDALANWILENTNEADQQNILNMLFERIRGNWKRRRKKPLFINVYRILCTENANFNSEKINNAIIKYVLGNPDLEYLDIDTYHWLYKSFQNNFDDEIKRKLENKYEGFISTKNERRNRRVYIAKYHKYFYFLHDRMGVGGMPWSETDFKNYFEKRP